ncbi:helix-turn-helix domain-containing protein [Gynurincola endophyticus]|uniref:helix-turn-helix domain-containing protein n=1 Tax=Gynurincola endophyticus TaxID=2479004 RepID=UPI000F8DFDE5|nr:helix-turn-helix transcriptional regulator [Gynurincola endophyticus]
MPVKSRNDLSIQIGKALKELRLEAGYTSQEEFAWKNDFDRNHYSKMERGDIDIKVVTLAKILEAFDTSLEDFFSRLEK